MNAMNIQERYDELAQLSGCSEQVVRRVLKAVQQSLVKSLKQGCNATLPGVCTLYPELRSKLDISGKNSVQYVKIKAKASSALETEFCKVQSFEDKKEEVEDISNILNLDKPELHSTKTGESLVSPITISMENRYAKNGIRTKQINALL